MIHYFIDTNVIRYLSQTSTTEKILNEHWLAAAEIFLDKALEEIENDKARLRIPLEVYRELELHSLNYQTHWIWASEEIKQYVELLKHISERTPHTEYSTEAIYRLKILAVYLSKYNHPLKNSGFDFSFKAGGENDVRILCAAYDYEGVIVTGNIKDFLVYLLLNDEMEQKDILYNIETNEYVKIPEDILQTIWADQDFQNYKQEFLLALEKVE